MQNKSLSSVCKITAILIFSAITATGVFPYGYHFSHVFTDYVPEIAEIIIGITLASFATMGNMGLATYSLLKIHAKPPAMFNRFYISILGALSAVSTGFLFYFAYQEMLPASICLMASIIVYAINVGINYVAMINFLIGMTDNNLTKLPLGEKIVRIIGLGIGISVSLLFYLVTVTGMNDLFVTMGMSTTMAYQSANVAAIITWIPMAALFSFSTQAVSSELYQLVSHFRQYTKKVNIYYLLVLTIALGSGSSFAEMAIEYFSLQDNVPRFFQAFSPTYMGALAYIAAFSVNYVALKNILAQVLEFNSRPHQTKSRKY